MPYTLPPLSRRRFLRGTLAAGAGVAMSAVLRGADAATADPDRIVLLSDVHIAADPMAVNKSVCMYDHLKRAVEQVLASGLRPSAGFITGDLAYSVGEPGDYATLIGALKPLREAGLPLHVTLGNHDHFANFRAAFPASEDVAPAPVASKQVAVVETPQANLFLLDSLDKPKMVPGLLGAAQLEWLAKGLDARKAKPAVILVHHNPDALPTAHGLVDTDKLYEAILPHRHVKAVVFGHTHTRSATAVEGVHLINLPAVAYVFKQGEPSGWTDLMLRDRGATFTLHAIDNAHPQDGEKYELEWRADA